MERLHIHTLKKQTMSGVVWNSIGLLGTQGIQFAVGIVMARLLLPADFGLVGMLSIFIMISQSFIDSGFGQALIRKADATEQDYSTVFIFNIIVSLAVYIVLYLSAPLISIFYREPQLTGIARITSLSLIINAFGLIHKTVFTKKMVFKAQALISLLSSVLCAPVGIYLAFCGKGVWALVFQSLASSLVNTVLLWFFNRWRPTLIFCKKTFDEMFSFGSKLLLSGLLDTVYSNLSQIIIGKVFNAESLGFYTRAYQLQALPVQSISQVVQNVTYPLYSKIQTDKPLLKSGFKTTSKMLAFLIFPICATLYLIAEPFIRLLLTEKWLPSVPIMKLFLLFGWLYPFHAINLNIIKVGGRSDLFLRLEIIKKVLVTISLAATVPFGIFPMIYGQMVCSVIAYFINTYYSGRMIGYHWTEQIKDMAPFFAATGLAFAAAELIAVHSKNDVVNIITVFFAGTVTYLALTYKFWRKESRLFFGKKEEVQI